MNENYENLSENYKKILMQYLSNILKIKDYEKKLELKYKDILIKDDNHSNFYQIQNKIYLDKLKLEELDFFKNNYLNLDINEEKCKNFLEQTYKRVTRNSFEEKIKIYYPNGIDDINNFISDGTIVFKIKYKESLTSDIRKQLSVEKELLTDLKVYDEEMSKILQMPVKTICEIIFVNN